jgi:hypothetical protein
MLTESAIWDSVGEYVLYSQNVFRLKKPGKNESFTIEKQIADSQFLLPLINSADRLWPYDTEPDPRALGSLVEILRGCRFVPDNNGRTAIVSSVRHSRMQGAYDTPQAIVEYITEATLAPLCGTAKPPLVLDPACGAGYFLISAFEFLKKYYPQLKPEKLIENCILGFDMEDVAIALSRRNLEWHLKKNHGISIDKNALSGIVLKADSLSDNPEVVSKVGKIDAVIGNPPYQFLTGRGSPVAALQRDGEFAAANDLADEIAALTIQFPRSSKGCKDRYKWFIDRATQFPGNSGRLGFITPNTWLFYPRYADIRELLVSDGRLEAIADFGSCAFNRAHVPAAAFIWQKGEPGIYKKFPFARIGKDEWDVINDSESIADALKETQIAYVDERYNIISDFPAMNSIQHEDDLIAVLRNRPYSDFRASLADIAVLREGSHAIRAISRNASRIQGGENTYPVLIDKTMGPLVAPDIGYIIPNEKCPSRDRHHSGERFLIRKTGDRLLVAPSPTENFALAHQNVYVGKLKASAIPFPALLGILNSTLITRIYRTGPGGQEGRIHAQLRIEFLNRLPIPVVPNESALGEKHSRKIEKISVLYNEISRITQKLISAQSEKDKAELDKLVYDLYLETET